MPFDARKRTFRSRPHLGHCITRPIGRATAITVSPPGTIACINSQRDPSADPAVAEWREWQDAHEETERSSREQQRLERQLLETVGLGNSFLPDNVRHDMIERSLGGSLAGLCEVS